jgi:Nitrile hydratase, alpha chain
MSEATGGGGSRRAEVEWRLIKRSLEDEEFRQRLLADPRAVIEQELGSRLPESVEVRLVEETADTIYVWIPHASAVGQGAELSEQELDAVAGGFSYSDTCARICPP